MDFRETFKEKILDYARTVDTDNTCEKGLLAAMFQSYIRLCDVSPDSDEASDLGLYIESLYQQSTGEEQNEDEWQEILYNNLY